MLRSMDLGTHELLIMFLALGTLLTFARIMGEAARALGQPSVIGELLAGILLGPTVLGSLFPGISQSLFPLIGPNAVALKAFANLAVVLFLLVAGMELDLSTVLRQGRTAVVVSVMGIVVPFILGFGGGMALPEALGAEPGGDRLIFALFLATALSITALPVIAKTLMDLALYRSDFGMLIMAAAIVNDLAGWIIFAIVLSLISVNGPGLGIPSTIALTLGFSVVMLTVGRWLIHKVLPWVQAYLSWPGGVLSFALVLALFGAAFTEWIGVHAIFGSFMVGVALGDSEHLRERTRAVIDRFTSFFFAPLFFGWIGLQVNFARNFDLPLVLLVLAIACAGKLIGCVWAGRLTGMPRNESWALGVAMNSRGMMEIILGHLALQYGIISERMFVALVVMALVTSMATGPLLQRLLKTHRPARLLDYLTPRGYRARLAATSPEAAIAELCATLGPQPGLTVAELRTAAIERERLMATGMGDGVAVPHARMPLLTQTLVALGMSEHGIDFDAPDGAPAHLILLIFTPGREQATQIQLLADVARIFKNAATRERALSVGSYTELLALLRSEAG